VVFREHISVLTYSVLTFSKELYCDPYVMNVHMPGSLFNEYVAHINMETAETCKDLFSFVGDDIMLFWLVCKHFREISRQNIGCKLTNMEPGSRVWRGQWSHENSCRDKTLIFVQKFCGLRLARSSVNFSICLSHPSLPLVKTLRM
jgi:hypothetical protein